MTERDAVIKLDGICSCYGNSHEFGNRLAQGISEYMQAVSQSGQDKQNGNFNCSHVKKVFGISFMDTPAVRYNKITTYRV